jgi:hypothetical protein
VTLCGAPDGPPRPRRSGGRRGSWPLEATTPEDSLQQESLGRWKENSRLGHSGVARLSKRSFRESLQAEVSEKTC